MLAQVRARANLGEVGRPCEGEGGGMDVRTVKDLCQRLDELGTILELMEGEPVNVAVQVLNFAQPNERPVAYPFRELAAGRSK